MVEIIPSINAPTFGEVQARIKKVEPYVTWCHLDVTDGVFSSHATWHDPFDLSRIDTVLKVEAHLMVADPEKVIDQWLVAPIKRVIVHLEATADAQSIIDRCRSAGVEIGLAISPETSWKRLLLWFGKVDLLQVLAVPQGPSGQKMGDDALDKVRHLRQACPGCIIEIDGGINQETAPRAKAAGADILVAGSAIFNSSDIAQAIASLQSVQV